MAKSISMIGIDAEEVRWLRMVLQLLRHPDANVPELTRRALLYLTESAQSNGQAEIEPLDQTG